MKATPKLGYIFRWHDLRISYKSLVQNNIFLFVLHILNYLSMLRVNNLNSRALIKIKKKKLYSDHVLEVFFGIFFLGYIFVPKQCFFIVLWTIDCYSLPELEKINWNRKTCMSSNQHNFLKPSVWGNSKYSETI